jgi:hypothetical protein
MHSGHPPIQRLADMAAGLLGASARSKLEQHVARCARCSVALDGLTATITDTRFDDTPAAPDSLVARARRLFQPGADGQLSPTGPVERLVGTLRFDSATMPPAFGLRGAADRATRRLLFEAGAFELDLQTTRAKAGWTISGQLLGPTDATSGEVRLLGGKVNARCDLNELLEFTLPVVPTGKYRLELQAGGATQVSIESLELGS